MEQEKKSSPETEKRDKPEQAKPEVLLALIEYGSRPAAILLIGVFVVLWLFSVREPLFQLLGQAQELKIGSFEVQLREDAVYANLDTELRALKELSLAQLQLFLVVGRERERITYNGPEVTQENLRALEQAGLLSEVRRTDDGGLEWRVSSKGHELHELIFSQLLFSIRRSIAS
jgi:hypothetical protein